MSTHRPELARAVWRASSYSAASGNCVEIADLHEGDRAVCDSKNPTGAVLVFGPAEWSAFCAGLRDGQFD